MMLGRFVNVASFESARFVQRYKDQWQLGSSSSLQKAGGMGAVKSEKWRGSWGSSHTNIKICLMPSR
jgi:hypothetical protein